MPQKAATANGGDAHVPGFAGHDATARQEAETAPTPPDPRLPPQDAPGAGDKKGQWDEKRANPQHIRKKTTDVSAEKPRLVGDRFSGTGNVRQAWVLRVIGAETEQQKQPGKKKKEPENIPGKFIARSDNLI